VLPIKNPAIPERAIVAMTIRSAFNLWVNTGIPMRPLLDGGVFLAQHSKFTKDILVILVDSEQSKSTKSDTIFLYIK